MSTVTISLNVDSSILAQAENALCWAGGSSTVSAANAKVQLITYVQNVMVDYQNMLNAQAVSAPAQGLIS